MKNNQSIYLILIILFSLNPFFGVFALVNLLFIIKYKNDKFYNLLIIFLSILLSLINITKVPESDLLNHGLRYLQSGDFNFPAYLIHQRKEPIYYIFDYILYHLSNGSLNAWVISFTFFSYFFIFKSILLFFRKIKASRIQIILGLMIAAFFPLIFSLSAHLIRQFIASSIFIYFAVNKIFYNKNKWWLIIIGVFTHSSSALMFPLVYLSFLGDFKNKKALNISLLIILTSYQFIASILYEILDGKYPMLSYILKRASGDTTYDLGEFPIINIIIILIMMVITVLYNSFYVNSSEKKSVRHFFAISWFLSIFILFNTHQSELSLRMFYYLIFFLPFIIPLMFKKENVINTFFVYVMCIGLSFYFLYKLVYGTWTYAPLLELLSNSIVSFSKGP